MSDHSEGQCLVSSVTVLPDSRGGDLHLGAEGSSESCMRMQTGA